MLVSMFVLLRSLTPTCTSAMRMLEDGYSPFGDDGNFAKECAKSAVSYADALLAELRKGESL